MPELSNAQAIHPSIYAKRTGSTHSRLTLIVRGIILNPSPLYRFPVDFYRKYHHAIWQQAIIRKHLCKIWRW